MIAGVKMRVLEVFLLAALGCSLAEGGLVSKCDLRDQLMKAIGGLPEHERPKGVMVDNLVAHIVCHVELASGFNTSAVNELTVKEEDVDRRRKRDTNEGFFGLAKPEDPLTTIQPPTWKQQDARQPQPQPWPKPVTRPPPPPPYLPIIYPPILLAGNARKPPPQTQTTPVTRPPPPPPNRPINTNRHHVLFARNARKPPPQTQTTPVTRPPPPPPNRPTLCSKHPHTKEDIWTLYGLFQLSDHLVCNGTTPSSNICGMDCSNLIDDDTSDDISCVFKIFTDITSGAAHSEELKKMINLIYQEECKVKVASGYFAGCP